MWLSTPWALTILRLLNGRCEDRLLLTEDKDFGDLIFRRGRMAPGIVLMRIVPENPRLIEERLSAAINQYGERLFGQYLVVEEGRFRSRPLWED